MLGKKTVRCTTNKTITLVLESNNQDHYLNVYENGRGTVPDVGSRRIVRYDEQLFGDLERVLGDFARRKDEFTKVTRFGVLTRRSLQCGQSKSYFVDVCQNEQGYHVKLSALITVPPDNYCKESFITFPLENLPEFYHQYISLMDESYRNNPKHINYFHKSRLPVTSVGSEVDSSVSCHRSSKQPPSSSDHNHSFNPTVVWTHQITAEKSIFKFYVKKKGKKYHMCLSEIDMITGKQLNELTIPRSCWQEISEIFAEFAETVSGTRENGTYDCHSFEEKKKALTYDRKLPKFKKMSPITTNFDPLLNTPKTLLPSDHGCQENHSESQSAQTLHHNSKPYTDYPISSTSDSTTSGWKAVQHEYESPSDFHRSTKEKYPSSFIDSSNVGHQSHGMQRGTGNRYVESLEKFRERVQEFWQMSGRQRFPSSERRVKWQVYYVYKSWFGHYSLMFECVETGYSFIIELKNNLGTEELELSFRIINLCQPNYADLKKNRLGSINMSGNEILLNAYRVLKKMGPFNAMSNNCQDFVKNLSKELCLDLSILSGRDVAAAAAGGTLMAGAVAVGMIIVRILLRC